MNDMDDEAVEKVLQRQHAELITRMEGWFKHLEAVLEAKDHSSRAPRAPEWNRFDGDPEAIGLQSKDLALEALELSSVLEDSCDLSVANKETHRAKETFGHAEALQGGSSMDHMQTTMQNRLRRTESQLSYQKARTLGDRIESFKREQTESLSMHRKRSAISLWWEATVRVRAQYVAEALPFNVFFAFVILSNSLFLGLQLEMKASGETPASLTVVNVIYAILFTGEMTIRIMAMGLSTYLFGKGAGWNWLDVLALASGSLLEDSEVHQCAACFGDVCRGHHSPAAVGADSVGPGTIQLWNSLHRCCLGLFGFQWARCGSNEIFWDSLYVSHDAFQIDLGWIGLGICS